MIGPDLGRLAVLSALDHDHIDAAPGEVQGERQADRPSPDDQDLGFAGMAHSRLQGLLL